MPSDSHARSITKALSWRLIATVITAVVAGGITGSITVGVGIGLADSVVKLVAYYAHERAWQGSREGLQIKSVGQREAL